MINFQILVGMYSSYLLVFLLMYRLEINILI